MSEKQSIYTVLLSDGTKGTTFASTKHEAKQKAIVKYDDPKCIIK